MNRIAKIADKSGAALIWAVLATCILSVVVAGILTFSYGFLMESIRGHEDRQAMLYARSGIDILTENVVSGSLTELPENTGDVKTYTFTFGTDAQCVVTATRTEALRMKLSAVAVNADGSAELVAFLSLPTTGTPVWSFDGYSAK